MFETKRKRKIGSIIILAIAATLIGGRLYLPIWAKGYVNQKIETLTDYSGSVKDIDIHLWRGAYQIHGLEILKNDGGLEKPFVTAETVDLSIEWRALLNSAIVAEIDIHSADLNFSKTQTGEGAGWINLVRALSPFDINRLEVHKTDIAYIDYTAEPNINLFLKNVDAKITNLRQIKNKQSTLPSELTITGTSIGNGKLNITGDVNILKEQPDFDIGFELKDAYIIAFNDFSRNIAALDFEKGTFGIFAELASTNGQVTGYIKPVARNVSVVSLEQDSNPFNALWESIASIFIELFQNQSQDQLAMRIPINGSLNNPDSDILSGFFSIFSNAFGKAFNRDEDGTVNFKDILESKELKQ